MLPEEWSEEFIAWLAEQDWKAIRAALIAGAILLIVQACVT